MDQANNLIFQGSGEIFHVFLGFSGYLAQTTNFRKKSTKNFTGPGNLILHIQLMTMYNYCHEFWFQFCPLESNPGHTNLTCQMLVLPLYRGSQLSTVLLSTIPGIVQFEIVQNRTNSPIQYDLQEFHSQSLNTFHSNLFLKQYLMQIAYISFKKSKI